MNGEEAPVSEIVVANGLDVTKENLLALRYDDTSSYFVADRMFYALLLVVAM